MMKTVVTYLIFGFFLYSCSSAGQMQKSTAKSQTAEQSMSENSAPSWYDHSNRTYMDSTYFAGTGSAIASDSLDAIQKSVDQARENLQYSIDMYAESLRRKLSEEASGSNFSSSSFVLSLRQAVRNLRFSESDLKIESDHTALDGPVHRVYSRVSLDKDRAIDMLASAVGNDLFSRSLREQSSM